MEKVAIGFSRFIKRHNIETAFFYLFLLLLPTQAGKHFWPPFAFVLGIRVDYLSPTLYYTDLLLLILFFLWIFRKTTFTANVLFWIIGSSAIIFIGLLFAKSPFALLYGYFKFLELIFLGLYTKEFFTTRKSLIEIPFAIGILFESLLGAAQYIYHSSLGGIFYYTGERTFTAQTPGIANASINGELVLRPYATFSHPNVLAGYLIVAMMLVISQINNKQTIKNVFLGLSLIIGTIVLFLTLSRVAIVLWLAFIAYWFITFFKKKIFYLLCILLFVSMLFGAFFFHPLFFNRFLATSLSDESFVFREHLAQDAIKMLAVNPVFGVGLNNFLVALPSFSKTTTSVLLLQPVHNIFLLIASETGLLGFCLLGVFLIKTYKHVLRVKKYQARILLLMLTAILVLGLVDHFFVTLQQGQLLFAFVLGLCWSM